MPTWITIFQALATPAIALLAVAIGGVQWWTARQRLVFDLFEKRFQVFLDVRRIASEALQLGKLNDYGEMNEIVARARYLFGDDVFDKIKEMHSRTCALEVREPSAHMKINNLFD